MLSPWTDGGLGYPLAEEYFLNINIFDGKLFQSIYLDFKYGRQKLQSVVSENSLGDAPLLLRSTLSKRNTLNSVLLLCKYCYSLL